MRKMLLIGFGFAIVCAQAIPPLASPAHPSSQESTTISWLNQKRPPPQDLLDPADRTIRLIHVRVMVTPSPPTTVPTPPRHTTAKPAPRLIHSTPWPVAQPVPHGSFTCPPPHVSDTAAVLSWAPYLSYYATVRPGVPIPWNVTEMELIMCGESGGSVTAVNPSSGACNLLQLLPCPGAMSGPQAITYGYVHKFLPDAQSASTHHDGYAPWAR